MVYNLVEAGSAIIMNESIKEKVKKEIREILADYQEVRFAYLFGSWPEGISGPDSDLDIAFFLDEDSIQNLDPLFETRLALEIEEAIFASLEVDVLVLNRVSLVMKYQVTNKGELFYYRDEGEARDYEALIRKKYFDFYPMRKEYNEERSKRYGVPG